jgi:hypothetical protein
MSEEEVRRSITKAKKRLEIILEEHEGFFIAPSDITFINRLLDGVNKYMNRLSAYINTFTHKKQNGTRVFADYDGSIENRLMTPFGFGNYDNRIIERIIDHANYFKNHGEIRYKMGDKFVSLDEVREKINILIKSKFIPYQGKQVLTSILGQSLAYNHISTKQTMLIEDVFDGHNTKTNDEAQGVIYFHPHLRTKGFSVHNYDYANAKKIIMFALTGKKNTGTFANHKIVRFRKKFVNDQGIVDLSQLREDFKVSYRERSRFDRYIPVFDRLETYLNAADPEKYDINGLIEARPKALAEN